VLQKLRDTSTVLFTLRVLKYRRNSLFNSIVAFQQASCLRQAYAEFDVEEAVANLLSHCIEGYILLIAIALKILLIEFVA
jgi:hypothetical protein